MLITEIITKLEERIELLDVKRRESDDIQDMALFAMQAEGVDYALSLLCGTPPSCGACQPFYGKVSTG